MKKLFIVLMGALGGYVLYYYVVMEVVTMFFYSSQHRTMYIILCLISLCSSICFCTVATIGIWMHQLSPLLLKLLYACYFLVLGFVLFYRTPLEQVFIWNPFESMRELAKPEMRIESLLNIAIFIPLGLMLRKWNYSKVIIYAAGLSVLVELYQGFSKRGYCDTFDMILYLVGISIGYWIGRKKEKDFVRQPKG